MRLIWNTLIIIFLVFLLYLIIDDILHPRYDIVCIGLGISGLYFGYKCAKEDVKKKILFLEKQERIGGRISSIQLNPDEGYYAEGCAQRYFQDVDLSVDSLVNELGLKPYSQRNDSVQTEKTYIDLYKNLTDMFPPDLTSNKYSGLSFPLELIKANEYDYLAALEFGKTIGYPLFQYPINLNMAYQTLERLNSPIQQLIPGGYQNICNLLFEKIKRRYDSKFGYSVYSINYDGKYYTINNKYRCKKLLFTGTINELNLINLIPKHLREIKKMVDEKYFNYGSIRMYLQFDKPFWEWEKDIQKDSTDFYRWNSLSPFNQVEYYSQSTLLLYSNMEYAEMLIDLVPFEYRDEEKMTWIESEKMPELLEFVRRILPQILKISDLQSLESISKIAFKYRADGAQFVKPIPEDKYDDFFNNISQNKNFFMLSGDYTKNPGWIDSCLENVDIKFKDIV